MLLIYILTTMTGNGSVFFEAHNFLLNSASDVMTFAEKSYLTFLLWQSLVAYI